MKKLKPYREIINGDKVIIANRDTGSWIRISRQCRDIVCTACEFSLTNSEILESLADDEDRIYINELLKKLKELGVIGDEEKEEVIDVVYLLLTNRCNLKCIHCCADAADENSEVYRREMSTQEWTGIIDKIVDIEPGGIVLTGGEPLLRKDFFEIIRYLRSKYNGKVALATNATLINDDNVKLLAELIDKFDISIDGVDEESCSIVRGKGAYDKVINSVHLLKKNDVKEITLSMTFGTTNFHLKEKFFELNKKLNTKPIVRIFMPKGRGEKSVKKFNSYIQEDIDTVLSEKEIRDAKKSMKIITCGAGISEFVVNYDGWIYPCPNMINNKYKLIHMNDVGNLKKLNDEIFEKNAEVFCQLMNIQPENVKRCKDCKVNLFCWSCLEDIELHIKDEAAFLRRCENKKKILYQILWD